MMEIKLICCMEMGWNGHVLASLMVLERQVALFLWPTEQVSPENRDRINSPKYFISNKKKGQKN
jgi:hypothetical protein